MTNYTEFDAALLAEIDAGRNTRTHFMGKLGSQARQIKPDTHYWRTIDRRLQAMRKAGKIAFNSKTGWSRA